MRQFDILENPNLASRRYAPYVVLLQSHRLDPLDTILLAPLVNDSQRAVSIPVEFRGQFFALVAAEMAGIGRQGLGRVLGSAASAEDEIRRAIEKLLSGF